MKVWSKFEVEIMMKLLNEDKTWRFELIYKQHLGSKVDL